MLTARGIAGLVLLAFVGTTTFGDPGPTTRPRQRKGEMPDPALGYNWRQSYYAKSLGPEGIEKLARDKVMIVADERRQPYQFYEHAAPVFITSDSLLHAWNVLLAESVQRMEQGHTRLLGDILATMWDGLATADQHVTGDAALSAAARRRARIVLGVARKLLGTPGFRTGDDLDRTIDTEVAKVNEAALIQQPDWLPGDAALRTLDYNAFKPRGFYTRSPELERYFRAVGWLQAIPFALKQDEEFLAWLLLGKAWNIERTGELGEDLTKRDRFDGYFSRYAKFFGDDDAIDWRSAGSEAGRDFAIDLGKGELAARRKEIIRRLEYNAEQAARRRSITPPAAPAPIPTVFHLLESHDLPDGLLLAHTGGLREGLPSGLEVAAMLGSSFAASEVRHPQRKRILEEIDKARQQLMQRVTSEPDAGGVYGQYLNCLSTLLDPPEKEAPALFASDPWRAKSCATVLGAWVQTRHTWVLEAKLRGPIFGIAGPVPPGFIEPTPEFFGRLATLAEKTTTLLDQAGALDFEPAMAAIELRAVAGLIRTRRLADADEGKLMPYSDDDMAFFRCSEWCDALLSEQIRDVAPRIKSPQAPRLLEKVADDILANRAVPGAQMKWLREQQLPLRPIWTKLSHLCRRLEALAHKQLRGGAFNAEETLFFRNYGDVLKELTLHGPHHSVDPRDDVPKVVDVAVWKKSVLQVAIGRPRLLLVLYPYHGGEVICCGAVIPYYEFATESRLNDEQWKAMHNGKIRPILPEWEGKLTFEPPKQSE